tara:strand:+ start:60 stop:575 length:516 start_codon:yes stop_codon:yes gene_type:complete
MVLVNVIQIDGSSSERNIDEITTKNLSKACGFRKTDDFDIRHTWTIQDKKDTFYIEIWARCYGKEKSINKCDLPPPLDNSFLYGKIVAVCKNADKIYCDLTEANWDKYYEYLFGGFDNIDQNVSEDEAEADELADVDPKLLTSTGYLKDDFVVDDDNISMDSQLNEEEYLE